MYGFLYNLKYVNIQAKNNKLLGLDKIIDFQKNNTAGFKIRLLSIVNILVHLLPLMLLLFVIFKYFGIFKIDVLKAIVVNYIVAFTLGFVSAEKSVFIIF